MLNYCCKCKCSVQHFVVIFIEYFTINHIMTCTFQICGSKFPSTTTHLVLHDVLQDLPGRAQRLLPGCARPVTHCIGLHRSLNDLQKCSEVTSSETGSCAQKRKVASGCFCETFKGLWMLIEWVTCQYNTGEASKPDQCFQDASNLELTRSKWRRAQLTTHTWSQKPHFGKSCSRLI